MKTSTLLRIPLLAAVHGAAFAASAQNIVQNPGFETGATAPWTVVNGGVGDEAHTGSNAAYLGFPLSGTPSSLSQSLATVPGTAYSVSFWLRGRQGGNSFSASFGDTVLVSSTNLPPFEYTQFTYAATATASTTVLRFDFLDRLNACRIDDVSVTPVPEPASMAALGLGALGLLRRRKRA